MRKLSRSEVIGVAFGVAMTSFFVWTAYDTPQHKVYKSADGRPFVCNPTMYPDELEETLKAPVAERGEPGNCVFIDRVRTY